jgi:hypothetical protein
VPVKVWPTEHINVRGRREMCLCLLALLHRTLHLPSDRGTVVAYGTDSYKVLTRVCIYWTVGPASYQEGNERIIVAGALVLMCTKSSSYNISIK